MNVKYITKLSENQTNKKNKLDEIRVELMTFPMLRERATNYATRPLLSFCCIISLTRCLIYKAWFYWLFITLVVAHHLGIELFSISIFGILFTPH